MPCGRAPRRARPLRSEPSRMTVSYLSHPNARRPIDAAARHLDTQGVRVLPGVLAAGVRSRVAREVDASRKLFGSALLQL